MKQFTKLSIGFAIVAMMAIQSYDAQAQNKFNFGLSSPHYFGTGRFGTYLDLINELQEGTGSDALSFRPSAGIGLFAELQFFEKWSFDLYWQRYANATNMALTTHDNNKYQYKMSHSIFGVGASRKAFEIKGYDVWFFSAMSGGARNFASRADGEKYNNEKGEGALSYQIASTEAPIYLNVGLVPRFKFAEKFFFNPKIGIETELMRGDGNAMHDGLPDHIRYTSKLTHEDVSAIKREYGEYYKKHMTRVFVELRVGMTLGKPF